MKYLFIASLCASAFGITQFVYATTDATTLVVQGRSIPENSLVTAPTPTVVSTDPKTITGDPDFDLLKVAPPPPPAPSPAGDPDFGLIRVAPTPAPTSGKLPPGDPDFDLLRVSPTPQSPIYNDEVNKGENPLHEIKKQIPPPSVSGLPTTTGVDIKDYDDDEDGVPSKTEDIDTSVSVSAVTVRGWDPKKKEEFMSEQKTFAEVRSQQDLENFAAGVLLKDETIEEVQFNPKEISVSYQAEGKLLWLFPMNYTERLVVSEEDGALSFEGKKPWYGFLIHSNEDPDETAAAAKVKHKETINMDAISWGVSNHASLLNSISNVLKTKHDTAKNSVSNVR